MGWSNYKGKTYRPSSWSTPKKKVATSTASTTSGGGSSSKTKESLKKLLTPTSPTLGSPLYKAPTTPVLGTPTTPSGGGSSSKTAESLKKLLTPTSPSFGSPLYQAPPTNVLGGSLSGTSTPVTATQPPSVVGGQSSFMGTVKEGLRMFEQGAKDRPAYSMVPSMGMVGAVAKMPGLPVAVAKMMKAGPVKALTTADAIGKNTKAVGQTYSYLEKLMIQLKKPKVVVGVAAGLVVAAISSWPFANFIKEEALQTTNMAFSSAWKNKDAEGMQESTAMVDEILDTSTTEAIVQTVPFVNVVARLNEFFDAARLQNDVNKKIMQDELVKQQTGETDAGRWARIYAERDAAERERIDYYNSERLRVEAEIQRIRSQNTADRRAADRKAMEEQAAFWLDYQKRIAELEEQERIKQAEFWLAYRKQMMKLQSESGGSRLGFGLLR